MKLKKSFYITFIVAYLVTGYLSQMVVGIKWDESATLTQKILARTEMALIDGWQIKIIISLVCALIVNFITSRRK
jgi:ABC-type uncharacterized transport system permease subunit